MRGAVFVAIAVAVGNLLQGWDNATIAGVVLYIKKEFNLQSEPTIEGLIVAMSLIGAAAVTACSGPISDWLGRRPMLIISSLCYFISGLVMLWSPNVYVLLLGRLIDGFGVGLAVTVVPLYISETAPFEIRGLLNTLPQFTGSGGMFLSYCMVIGMSLMEKPNWRLMLGVLFVPSLIYFGLTVFFLPESPRWLVSKGRMSEARKVLQRLYGREYVFGEMALLVEGLEVGHKASIEEYIIGPYNELTDDLEPDALKDQIKLYGPEEGLYWVARPIPGQSSASFLGSTQQHGITLMDPLVNLFGHVHEKQPETGSMRSVIFPTFGSMFSIGGGQPKNEEWDEENVIENDDGDDNDDYAYDDSGANDSDSNLRSPLISRQTTAMEKDPLAPPSQGSIMSMRPSSFLGGAAGEQAGSVGIGGGWQLAWKWNEREGLDGKKEGEFKRIYLHQGGVPGSKLGSLVSLPGGDVTGENLKASALVSRPALYSKELLDQHPVGPAMIHPFEAATKGPRWRDLLEPGVRHALAVGVGIQILQQFSGINGVLYYMPQILEQAGVGVLLSNLGIGPIFASLLTCALTTLLMLPCIAVAIRLMDLAGRRSLLLGTIPILIVSLVILILGNLIDMGSITHAAISTISVIIYLCFFVMGFGPIPNILCAEIFPTRVRSLCIAICALAFWIGNIIVTYALPIMLSNIGLAGIFGMYAAVCIISFLFVFLKVPETKGMPLEVITEFFAFGARQNTAISKSN